MSVVPSCFGIIRVSILNMLVPSASVKSVPANRPQLSMPRLVLATAYLQGGSELACDGTLDTAAQNAGVLLREK